MNRFTRTLTAAVFASMATAAGAQELSLAYFMGPKHPMNAGMFTPFAEQISAATNGELTVRQFPGGALNSSPPKQYSIMLDGVADITFILPGYTADLFPKTNVVGLPGVCGSAAACTEALQRARAELETEYDAKVLAIWSNAPPVLITRDTPVTTLDDLKGMKIRVTSKRDAQFIEALGASPVAQPVSVINQNLANGVIDAIMVDPSAINSFKLHEPANYITTWFPGSGNSFALLMNRDVYEGLSDEKRAVIDAAAGPELSLTAGGTYDAAAQKGLQVAADGGVELLDWAPGEREKVEAVIAAAMEDIVAQSAGDKTIGDIIALMQGE